MRNSHTHLALLVVLAGLLVLGCGRPKDPRSAAEIRAESLPKVLGDWEIDREATLKEASAKVSKQNFTVIEAQMPTAILNLQFARNMEFKRNQVLGEYKSKCIGEFSVDATKVTLKQSHRIEPPVIPGALENSVPKKDKKYANLVGDKIHLTLPTDLTNVPYVLKRVVKEE